MNAQEWWKFFHDDLLADLLLEQNESIAQTIAFLEEQLDLNPGASLLDQCCGTGRLTTAMAERGYVMTGIDITASYIERARKKAASANLQIRLEIGDAFEFRADPPCHAAFNWWTSFGYARDDETNIQMLRRAWESIQPGGRFALDYMNVPGVFRHFQPQVVTRGRNAQGEIVLIRESQLDLAQGSIHKRWTYFLGDGRRVEHDSSVRLYDPVTLARLFMAAGFLKPVIFGNLDASPLTLNSPRCIVVGQKPSSQK